MTACSNENAKANRGELALNGKGKLPVHFLKKNKKKAMHVRSTHHTVMTVKRLINISMAARAKSSEITPEITCASMLNICYNTC